MAVLACRRSLVTLAVMYDMLFSDIIHCLTMNDECYGEMLEKSAVVFTELFKNKRGLLMGYSIKHKYDTKDK